jgi:hypothetical protein
VVQTWLSSNDPNYQPVFLDNQENLEECELIEAPSPSYISLDDTIPIVPSAAPVTPGIYLDEDPGVSLSNISIPEVHAEQAVLSAAAQAELEEAVRNIPGSNIDSSLSFQPLAVNGVYVSPSSSILADHSDIVTGTSRPPSTSSSISTIHSDVPFNPDFRDLLESYEFDISQLQPVVVANLNNNPHSNLASDGESEPSNHADVIVLSDDENALPDIPPTPEEEPEPVIGQYYRNLYDIYGPMRDLTNFEE